MKGEKECLEDMDKAGVEIALCSTIGPGFWFGNVEDTKRLAREINDYAGMMIAKYPKRFGVFTTIPLPDIDGSLKEIEYGFSNLKADGVFMHTNWGGKALYGDKYLGDPALAPIYEELNRRNAIVYTHPKDAACCERRDSRRRFGYGRIYDGYGAYNGESAVQRNGGEISEYSLDFFAWRRRASRHDRTPRGRAGKLSRGRWQIARGCTASSQESGDAEWCAVRAAEVLLR